MRWLQLVCSDCITYVIVYSAPTQVCHRPVGCARIVIFNKAIVVSFILESDSH
jgi:hypothetical protein